MRQVLKFRLVSALVCCITLSTANANPDQPTVVHGSAQFETLGQLLEITNSSGAIINWEDFSIDQGELTRFIQESGASAVLNRVIGGDASNILGQLQSNGQVFLINSNGIVFGESAVIDTRGFVASTLDISNDNFINGALQFAGSGGSIQNRGLIRVDGSGNIILLAPSIENSGIIQAENGEILLAAGREILVSSADIRGLVIKAQAPQDSVVNIGKIIARQGTMALVAGTLRQQGELRFTRDSSGRVFLEGDDNFVGGSIIAPGGEVQVLGDQIALNNSLIDTSSSSGGGRILIGGDFQGGNGVRTATTTTIGSGSTVSADGTGSGNGGEIIVWSDEATRIDGFLSARGGDLGGDGGFIETSSSGTLDFSQPPDVSAAEGEPGTWLIDPEDIEIDSDKASSIETALNQGSNVAIQTSDSGDGEGNISVNASITKSDGDDATLSLQAHNRIDVNAPIQSTSNKLNVNLSAGQSVNIDGGIDTNGGDLSTSITGVATESETEVEAVATAEANSDDVDTGTSVDESADIVDATDDPGEAESGALEALADSDPAVEVNADIFTQGGDIEIDTQYLGDIEINAIIDASTSESDQQGAIISIDARDFNLEGSLLAGSLEGQGGEVDIQVSGTATDGVDAVIDVSGATGGDITYVAEGDVTLSGTYTATGSQGNGGRIDITGKDIRLLAASVDASGESGGGRIRIGGEYQGGKDLEQDELPNAERLLVDNNTAIRADGGSASASGGEVILWSDQHTIALGNVSARQAINAMEALPQAKGGLVEISSSGVLNFDGTVNPGRGGTILFDPTNGTLTDTGPFTAIPGAGLVNFIDPPANSVFDVNDLLNFLDAGINPIFNVDNDFDVIADLDALFTGTGDLTINAGRHITFTNVAQFDIGGGNFTLLAGAPGANPANTGPGPATFTMNASQLSGGFGTGGNVTINADNILIENSAIFSEGTTTLGATQGVVIRNSQLTQSANVVIDSDTDQDRVGTLTIEATTATGTNVRAVGGFVLGSMTLTGESVFILGGDAIGAQTQLFSNGTINLTATGPVGVGVVNVFAGTQNNTRATVTSSAFATINVAGDTVNIQGGPGVNSTAQFQDNNGFGPININTNNCINCVAGGGASPIAGVFTLTAPFVPPAAVLPPVVIVPGGGGAPVVFNAAVAPMAANVPPLPAGVVLPPVVPTALLPLGVQDIIEDVIALIATSAQADPIEEPSPTTEVSINGAIEIDNSGPKLQCTP